MFDQMLKELQALNLPQEGSWDDDLYGTDLWGKYFENEGKYNYNEVDSELNLDKHRWFEISTTVLQFGDRFLGINHISNVYSESSGVSDCGHEYSFFEMLPVTVTTYVEKGIK